MLWIEPCSLVYASMFGGLVGGILMSWAYRKTQRDMMKRYENLWNDDLYDLRRRLSENDDRCACRAREIHLELSTKTVDKSVINNQGRKQGKSYNQSRHFNQRG